MGHKVRKIAETLHGWRDQHPDLTTGEHDTLVAMIELAWRDVQIDLDTVPDARREEALAAKISAWEWLTKPLAAYKADGMNPPRISFHAACLHLGLNEEATRWACLNRTCNPPHTRLPEPICPACEVMPNEWREAFFGPDEPEQHREDRPYVKKKLVEVQQEPVPTSGELLPPITQEAALPVPTPVEPLPPITREEPATVSPVTVTPEYCPALDEAPEHYTLQDLVLAIQPSRPASDAFSAWENALEETEEVEHTSEDAKSLRWGSLARLRHPKDRPHKTR